MVASQTSLEIVRTIHASADEVFAAWTDPQLIGRWLAPSSHNVRAAEVNAHVGGRYRIEVEGPGGDLHVTSGEYRELDPPHRLVKTWIYEGPEADATGAETLLTVEFREIRPELTELTLVHTSIPKAEYREMAREGWDGCLAKLIALHDARPVRLAARAHAAG